MVSAKVFLVLSLALLGSCVAQPAKPAFWKGTPMDGVVEEMRSSCAGNDAVACMKYKVMSLLDTIFKKDSYQVSDSVEVSRNSYTGNDVTARSEAGFLDTVEQYIQSHDVTFKLPVGDAKITVSPRNIDSDELNLSLKFAEESRAGKSVAAEPRKSKLKKIVIPILVFILLKAMTLIPLALGVLGLKAWNALQLSFFSFVISVALAIFQLCKKIAADNTHPQIAAHGPWDSYQHYARSFGFAPVEDNQAEAQDLAYNAYA